VARAVAALPAARDEGSVAGGVSTLSFRATLGAALASLAALAVASSAILVAMTSRMHETATRLRRSAEAVELAAGAHLALVSIDAMSRELADHGPAALAATLRDREAEVAHRLAALRGHVRTPGSAAYLEAAVQDVQAYLRARAAGVSPRRGTAAHAAFEAARTQLEALVREKIQDAEEAETEAARSDEIAHALAVGTSLLALAAIAGLLAWIRVRVMRPLGDLLEAIAAYGQGDRTSRAPAKGPSELRRFAASFNDMAQGVERQRDLQLEFVAAVAHDLRNPLTALEMALVRLRPDRPLPPEDRIRQTVDVVRRQVKRLERLLEDFLDASRIEAGRLSLAVADCDLRDLAREATDLFADASPAHPVELSVPADPVRARCDAARLAQVLNNLLSNAIKYSPRGGRIGVAVARDGDEATVSVSDEGIGVDPAERERIFEPFRRGAAAANGVPGAGLGLSISRRIAEAHGGRLEVQGRPGGGSTFSVRIPALPAVAAARPAAAGGP
jgi:signal transduction histidine kinase